MYCTFAPAGPDCSLIARSIAAVLTEPSGTIWEALIASLSFRSIGIDPIAGVESEPAGGWRDLWVVGLFCVGRTMVERMRLVIS